MTVHDRLKSYGTVATPPQAIEAAGRKPELWTPEGVTPCEAEWSDGCQVEASARFRDFAANWQHRDDAPGLDIWDNAKEVVRRTRIVLAGDCASFAPDLARTYMAHGIPRGALRPVLCTIGRQAHMVLDIETSWGTLIACNLTGLCWLEDARLGRHKWAARQIPGDGWERLFPLGLGALV